MSKSHKARGAAFFPFLTVKNIILFSGLSKKGRASFVLRCVFMELDVLTHFSNENRILGHLYYYLLCNYLNT